jgi:hypothetical protein
MSTIPLYKVDKIAITTFPEIMSQINENNRKFQSYSSWRTDVMRSLLVEPRTLVQYDDIWAFCNLAVTDSSNNLEIKTDMIQ